MNTSKNVIIGAIVLLAVIGIGWLLVKDHSDVDNPDASASPTTSVRYTVTPSPSATPRILRVLFESQGPVPATLQIRAGDAVSFVNNTDTQFWPVSDCSGFNAGRALRRNEIYTLIFSSTGTCAYHNQVDPANQTQRGTITVQ